jgi:hypothetical protein
MKAQDKDMIRQMVTEGTEMFIVFIERMEAIQHAKVEADVAEAKAAYKAARKARKAKARKAEKKAAKARAKNVHDEWSAKYPNLSGILAEAEVDGRLLKGRQLVGPNPFE